MRAPVPAPPVAAAAPPMAAAAPPAPAPPPARRPPPPRRPRPPPGGAPPPRRWQPRARRSRRVPLELVEVAQRGSAGADARRERAQLVVRDLAERALDAEVREVQVLLVDDRRDPRVDLDHLLADELDVEEVLDRELAHDRVREFHQARTL